MDARTEYSPQYILSHFGVEYKTLKRLGMKWAVLASLYHVLSRKTKVPPDVIRDIQTSRGIIEAGFFTVRAVDNILNAIERELISLAATWEEDSFDNWLDLLGKAMRGDLKPEEVQGLPFVRPMIPLYGFLRCTIAEVKEG